MTLSGGVCDTARDLPKERREQNRHREEFANQAREADPKYSSGQKHLNLLKHIQQDDPSLNAN